MVDGSGLVIIPGASYASSVTGEGDTASGTDQNTGTATDYSDITDLVIKYAGEMEGVGNSFPGRVIDFAVEVNILTQREADEIWRDNVLRWLG